MRGYFDDEEPERKARGRDIEVTLGAGALLGIFFGLVLLCGLCFGLGYSLGHRVSGTAAATAAHPAAQTAAPDQEPLQASGSIPKPSADAQAPAPQPVPGSDGTTPATGDEHESGGDAAGAADERLGKLACLRVHQPVRQLSRSRRCGRRFLLRQTHRRLDRQPRRTCIRRCPEGWSH